MTCYNCNQEGHMQKDCREPRAPRNNYNERPPQKRERRDEDQGQSFRNNDQGSSWENQGGDFGGQRQENTAGWGQDW